jgi:hypothetical protein
MGNIGKKIKETGRPEPVPATEPVPQQEPVKA